MSGEKFLTALAMGLKYVTGYILVELIAEAFEFEEPFRTLYLFLSGAALGWWIWRTHRHRWFDGH